LLFAIAIIWFLILLVLTCFGVAAVAEFRSGRRGAGFLLSIIQCAAVMISFSSLQSRFWGLTGLSSARLSWTMVCVSLLMGGLALLSKYASRVALSFVLIGNGILACLWYFNGAYHNVTDDRTASIDWAYEWDIDSPSDRILEKFRPGSVSKHGAIFFPPAIDQNGTIYLLRPHDYTNPKGLSLEAFNPNWLWEIRPSGGICTTPVIADDGTILFGTGASDGAMSMGLHVGQGLAWAVSPDGKKKWTHEFPPDSFFSTRDFGGGAVFPAKSPACSQPAVAEDGTTYWLGHGVYALTSDGALRWAFEPGEDFYFVSIADDGTVYALADGALFALAPHGAPKWKYSFEMSKYAAGELAIGPDGSIYLADNEPGPSSALFALAPQGTLKWRNESYELLGGPLVASDGTIYQEARDREIGTNTLVVALDRNGKHKWSTPIGSSPLAVASDGTLYICYIRDLFAMGRRGNMLWKAQLPEDPDSLTAHVPTKAVTLAPNRKFYIGDFLGRLGTLDAPVGMSTSGWPARYHDARNTSRARAH
jgi:outer membrane protein assembly factor BamB